MKKRLLVFMLTMCLALVLAVPAFGADYSDTDSHWAEGSITRWSDYGIIEGYNGLFDPNGELTRGQLAVILARLLNLPAADDAGFGDTAGHWSEYAINACAAAGIMLGDGTNAYPDEAISREQTMVMMGRALGITPIENADLSKFGDGDEVSGWAAGYVAALTEAGIVNGIAGSLAPDADIDRASTVTILNNAISAYANEPGQTVEAAGGIVLVVAPDVTVTGAADSVVVAQGAAGGTTTLEDATVGDVTVSAEESSVVVGDNAKAESVTVTEKATGAEVSVGRTATVGTVTTEAADSKVAVSGKVENVEVAETATGTNVQANSGATISKVDNSANGTTVSGNGTVTNVATSGDNTKVQTSGTKVEAAEGTTGTTAGNKEVTGGTATTTPTPSYTDSHSHSYTYKALNNGKHEKTCCGTSTEDCAYGEDNKCTKCGHLKDAVAKIGAEYYGSLTEAVAVGGEITLVKDVTVAATVEIAEGKTVVLDLNGYKLIGGWSDESAGKHIYALHNHGTLTVKDSSESAKGAIVSRGIYNYGTMALNGGTVDSCDGNGGYAIYCLGGSTFTMNGGAVITSYEDDDAPEAGNYDPTTIMIDEGATATINAGTVNNSSNYTFAINNSGTVTINDGTFTSVHTTLSNYGTMTVEGGAFTCNGLEGITAHVLVAWDGSTTNVVGGIFNGKDNYNGFNIDACKGSVVNVSGGIFQPVHSGSLYGEGTIVVTGGMFFDDPSDYVAPGYKATKEGDVWVVSSIFSGGSGTAEDPFILKTVDEVKKISQITTYSYFKVADGVESFDASNWPTDLTLVGNFDGNGVVFEKLDYVLFYNVGAYGDETNTYTIKNLTVNANINTTKSGIAAVARNVVSKMVFDNVDVHGHIEGVAGAASYVGFGPANRSDKSWDQVPFEITFKNCLSDATIVASGDMAVGFIKHPYSSYSNTIFCFVDSAYVGHMYATGAGNMKYFIGNNNSYPAKVTYSEEFLAELNFDPVGTLYNAGEAVDGNIWIGNYPANGGVADKYIYADHTCVLESTAGSIDGMSIGDAFTVAKAANAVGATVTLEITPNDKNNTGSYLGTYMTETIDLSGVSDSFTTSEIKYFEITVNAQNVDEGLAGNTYNVKNDFYGTTHNGAVVRISQYDKNGIVVSVTTYKIANANS